MSNPFFSIIIPVYNGLTHDLPICLESIWQQPLNPSKYEVICVDDCSTDDTRRWLDEQAAKHSNTCINSAGYSLFILSVLIYGIHGLPQW